MQSPVRTFINLPNPAIQGGNRDRHVTWITTACGVRAVREKRRKGAVRLIPQAVRRFRHAHP